MRAEYTSTWAGMRSAHILLSGVLGALMGLTALPADARRTVVDFAPDDVNFENPMTMDIGGYCDFDGTECQSVPLGFGVYFSDQQGYGSAIAYGNGVLEFTNQNGDANAIVSGNPIGATITAGAISSASEDFYFNYSFENGVYWSPLSVSLFSCPSTSSCLSPVWDMTLAPKSTGFDVSITYYRASPLGGWAAGYTAPPTDDNPFGTSTFYSVQGGAGTTFDFFVPATLIGLDPPIDPGTGAVPEPATWAMMIAGFGAIGGALRRRRTKPGAGTVVTPVAVAN